MNNKFDVSCIVMYSLHLITDDLSKGVQCMNKKRLLLVSLLMLFLFINTSNMVVASGKSNINLTTTFYNADTACWEFKIEYVLNERIYYTFKDNETLDKSCSFINSGQAISVPSSLIKNSYKTLKLFTLDKKGNISQKMYYRIDRISRNTYMDDLTKLCYSIFDFNDSQYTKARILYTWIGENKLYEYDGLTNHEYGALYGGTSACSGFARLYVDMCTIAGIKCEYVSEDIVDYKYTIWHAWNHIYLDDKIYLVDPTWSGVCFGNVLNYSHFCNNGIVNHIITPNYDLSSSIYDNFY